MALHGLMIMLLSVARIQGFVVAYGPAARAFSVGDVSVHGFCVWCFSLNLSILAPSTT